MEDKLGFMVEMMRDIKSDIKDLEHTVNEMSKTLAKHSTTHQNFKEIENKVHELETFRGKVKGVGAVMAMLNGAILTYFKSKGV